LGSGVAHMQFNPLRWFEKKSYDLSDPRLLELFGQAPTISGFAIGPESALRVPAVSAAVRVIAESVASLPLNTLTYDGTSKSVSRSHAVYAIVNSEPNAWTSSYDFRLQMQTDTLLHGNAYAFVNRVGGKVREILRLHPTTVSVAIDLYSGEPTYTITDKNGGMKKCAFSDIIHIKAQSTNGVTGIAPIQLGREAIALGLALEAHAAKLMGNAARPSGVLKFKGLKLSETQLERIKTQWRAAHTASAAGGTAIFDSDTDFQPLTFSSVDLEFSAMRQFQLDEVSRAFRVPPHLLSNLGRVTWANASELGQNFLDYTLMPWLIQWQGALARALLTDEERIATTIEFDTSAITRANLQVRTESYSTAVGGPWLLPNEARALENRAPIASGNVLYPPSGTAKLPANDNDVPLKVDAA
jgi:HK97 family phage portal protein